MTHSLHVLDSIHVPEPCQVPWGEMHGNDQSRHCDQCDKAVHNLSAMTAEAAANLVRATNGNLCVRMARDAAGAVVTADPPTRRCWGVRRVLQLVASVFGLALASGCGEPRQRWSQGIPCRLLAGPDSPKEAAHQIAQSAATGFGEAIGVRGKATDAN